MVRRETLCSEDNRATLCLLFRREYKTFCRVPSRNHCYKEALNLKHLKYVVKAQPVGLCSIF